MSLLRRNHSYEVTGDQVQIINVSRSVEISNDSYYTFCITVGLCSGNLHKLNENVRKNYSSHMGTNAVGSDFPVV